MSQRLSPEFYQGPGPVSDVFGTVQSVPFHIPVKQVQSFKSLACVIDTDTGFELSLNIKGDNVCALPHGLC